MMNLRGVNISGGSLIGSLHRPGLSNIQLADNIVGNLGTPLGFGEQDQRCLANKPEGRDTQVANMTNDPLMGLFPSAPEELELVEMH